MKYDLHHGDALEVMRSLPAGSVDAVVTDPPYGLAFMGKEWDRGVPPVSVWAECYRLLPDGGRLLAFGGTRTAHRMWCAIEDAGFVIEDTVAWLYGSGFPKHGSKLKPGYEPVCVARKGGVSLLNVEGCRVGMTDADREAARVPQPAFNSPTGAIYGMKAGEGRNGEAFEPSTGGRWPANVAHDGSDEVLEAFARFGETQTHGGGTAYGLGYGSGSSTVRPLARGTDYGSPARFFYEAKASRAEREAGLEGMEKREAAQRYGLTAGGALPQQTPHKHEPARNGHPTVKPVALMRWLCRLVTPPGGTVLDPFTGSGTTGVACAEEGFRFVGIEREAEYVEIARRRIAHAHRQPSLFG